MTIQDIFQKHFRCALWIDFETRSTVDLKTVGSHRYNLDPTTEVLLCAYAFNGDPVRVVTADEIPDEVLNAIEDNTVLKIAHNAEFDMCVAKYVLHLEITWGNWFDTAYQAAYYGLPRKLAELADVLKTSRKASQEELKLFSFPIPKAFKKGTSETTKEYNRLLALFPPEWNTAETMPDAWEKFKLYAKGDVEVMRECAAKMPMLPSIEWNAMYLTFEMNFNGLPFDAELAKRIMERVHEYETNASAEALERYGIVNLRSVPQVQAALQKEGVFLPSLDVKKRGNVTHPILDLKDQATGSAFSKLPKAFLRVCPDGRLRGEIVGYGAHTGRYSSRGVQIQNWYRGGKGTSETLSNVKNYEHLKQHLRLCLGHHPRMMFTVADLAQIEARIVAYLAGCEWLIDVFASGGDPYSSTALKMFGGTLDPVTGKHPKRQHGKAAVLGFGYGGSGLAIERINKTFYDEIGASAAQDLCYMYREAHPEIKNLWYALDGAFREAMQRGVCHLRCYKVTLIFNFDGRNMRITLPSGRALFYRQVRETAGRWKPDLSYLDYGEGHATWQKLWHGTIIENTVQAIARDILVEAMVRSCARVPDAELVMSVHDEAGFLHPPHVPMLDIVLEEMARPITWAPGLITAGDGFTSDRYRK